MTRPTLVRLGAYLVGLLVVFAGAAGFGRAVGSVPVTASKTGPAAATAGQGNGHGETAGGHEETAGGHGKAAGGQAAGGHGEAADGHLPGGLQVSQDGYRLTPVTTTLTAGSTTDLAFRITGPDGAPVTRYTPTHERDLHLIVVRRDLTGFQHVHPALGADGTWRIPLTVATAGQYRIFTDFQPAGRTAPLTLGVDLPAPGGYAPAALPAPSHTMAVDGYTVDLSGDLTAGTESTLTLRISRDGTPVTDLQPYLGAYGHLVALRDGDLAYLHVHPDGGPGDGRTAAGPAVTFVADVPSAGPYRLYLDFQHAGRVHTAEFTAVAADK
ncbi:hypothetical protein ACNTMW_25495 [Planosporangium sp. 12N6]|uniref:hypothetical protein n=1 Tax=Planosporangium spinosum TaxID=3402278 RepID=UPI003CF2FC32